jgi:hypothetical protein
MAVNVVEPLARTEHVGSGRKRLYDLAAIITIAGAVVAAAHYFSGSHHQRPKGVAPKTVPKPGPKATRPAPSRDLHGSRPSTGAKVSSIANLTATHGRSVEKVRYEQKLPAATPAPQAKLPTHSAGPSKSEAPAARESAKATSGASGSAKTSGTSSAGTAARNSSSSTTPGGQVKSESEAITGSTSSASPPSGNGEGTATGEASGTASGDASFTVEH